MIADLDYALNMATWVAGAVFAVSFADYAWRSFRAIWRAKQRDFTTP